MKKALVFVLIAIFLATTISAQPDKNITDVYYFYGDTCSHCLNINKSGIMNNISRLDRVHLEKYEVYNNQTSREKFAEMAGKINISKEALSVPFAIIQCEDKYLTLAGDRPIILDLENKIKNCKTEGISLSGNVTPVDSNARQLTIGSIIIAAIIDSINPCAFGVLLFLMATLFKLGSSKRALKYGLIYSFVVFAVYFLAGLGILQILRSLSAELYYIYLVAAILVFIGGLIELKDFFWYGRGISLRIPTETKPFLERLMHRGTLPAIILLGFIVAMVELPCTGGIYVAILSMMSINKTFGVGYLFLYNIIFILPLVILTFLIYYGTNIESIKTWVENNKKYMRLAAGIIMILLAIYIFRAI